MGSSAVISASTAPRRLSPLLQRVLIVDPEDGAVGALVDLLRTISNCQVWTAPFDAGVDLAAKIAATLVFVEQSAGQDGAAFVSALRRVPSPARQTAVIMTTSRPTVFATIAARECGAHEVLRKPFVSADLVRRLESVALEPREWIETMTYVGPDRRRFNSGDYGAAAKREGDGGERGASVVQRASAG
jgi:DNA-binding response OmpR family regulator